MSAFALNQLNEVSSFTIFVAFAQELDDGAHLDVIVVGIDAWTHLDFLDVEGLLLLAGFGPLLLFLVFEFAVIEDFADRRLGGRGHLHQIKPGL